MTISKNKSWYFVIGGALLLGVLVLSILFASSITHATGTGVVTGVVWMDDNGNMILDVSTDSNGVQDSGEWISNPVKVFITDANGEQVVRSHVTDGSYSATVSTLIPVTVTVDVTSLNIPMHFEPTTDTLHVVSVDDGATTTIPSFGFGPPEDE